jgi:hypothetical protein
MSMYLSTGSLLPKEEEELPPSQQPGAGWDEVKKGLLSILGGYALTILSLFIFIGLLLTVAVQVTTATAVTTQKSNDAATILYVGAAIVLLSSLASFYFIIRGKWRCLMNAPEHCGVKWMMFVSLLCVAAGPPLSTASSFATEPPPGEARTAQEVDKMRPNEKLQHYRDSVAPHGAVGYIRLASGFVSLLSTVFFVLFLRGVALSFEDQTRARIAEGYLVLVGAVAVGTVVVVVNPTLLLTFPEVLLLLAGGWLLSFAGYLFLIVNTCACITVGLAQRRKVAP